MIMKHFVKLSKSFHSEIVFIMILSKVVLLLLSLGPGFRTRHYKIQLIFDFKGA